MCSACGDFYFLISGNYGNKLDENSPAQSSSTPPSNPIFDGNAYYYLPWMDQKPCIQVNNTLNVQFFFVVFHYTITFFFGGCDCHYK